MSSIVDVYSLYSVYTSTIAVIKYSRWVYNNVYLPSTLIIPAYNYGKTFLYPTTMVSENNKLGVDDYLVIENDKDKKGLKQNNNKTRRKSI